MQASQNNGNVIGTTNNLDNTRSLAYTYDQLNRLASAATVVTTGANAWGNSYVYDAWANLLQKNVTQGTSEFLSVNVDAHNHITTGSGYTYDAAGNVTADGNNAYLYDAENRMSPNSGGQAVYTYDGDDHRVKTVVVGTTTLNWYDDNFRPVSVGDGSGAIARDYVFFGGKRIGFTSLTSGNTHYYLTDHLGSPREIVNGDGTSVEWEADYYPFGGKRVLNNGLDTYFLFTGWEIDYELTFGIAYYYHAGFREQSTSIGRFLSPDPAGLAAVDASNPQSWNRYAYVLNNPLKAIDPLGLSWLDLFSASQPLLFPVGGGAAGVVDDYLSREFWGDRYYDLPGNADPIQQAFDKYEGQVNQAFEEAAQKKAACSGVEQKGGGVVTVTGASGARKYDFNAAGYLIGFSLQLTGPNDVFSKKGVTIFGNTFAGYERTSGGVSFGFSRPVLLEGWPNALFSSATFSNGSYTDVRGAIAIGAIPLGSPTQPSGPMLRQFNSDPSFRGAGALIDSVTGLVADTVTCGDVL